jgi:hypothetical protein
VSDPQTNADCGGADKRKRRGTFCALAAVTVIGASLCIAFWPRPPRLEPGSRMGESAHSPLGKNANTNTIATTNAFSALKGRWLRPDGGYILEIENVLAEGRIQAAYYNPRSIHVASAEAALDGGVPKVLVRLEDQGYPGCTYTLRLDPGKDELGGVYFQAALQESYDVVFVRTK